MSAQTPGIQGPLRLSEPQSSPGAPEAPHCALNAINGLHVIQQLGKDQGDDEAKLDLSI